MRQNRIKKFLTAGLSGLLILSLTGCGQAAKLPETVENTSLVVEKDGKVTSYLVNTFDKDFYNLDGLTQMVEEEAEEFNATHTEATENPMNVKTVQVLGDGAMVQVVQEFADTDSYAEYNEQDLFYGTRVEALAQGLTVNRELVNAADGTPADSEKLDKALEKILFSIILGNQYFLDWKMRISNMENALYCSRNRMHPLSPTEVSETHSKHEDILLGMFPHLPLW